MTSDYNLFHHPVLGLIVSIFMTVLGHQLPYVTCELHLQFPVIIVQTLQCFAWLGGGVVACITIFEWLKKQKWVKKHRKDLRKKLTL